MKFDFHEFFNKALNGSSDNKIVFDSFKNDFSFTWNEIKDIAISCAAIAAAFTIAINIGKPIDFWTVIYFFVLSLFAVGIGFVLHELSHKYVAIKNDFEAVFVSSYPNIVFMLIVSFFGVVFAAPGAVVIKKKGNVVYSPARLIEKMGVISIAGPLMNIFLAVVFMLLYFAFGSVFFSFGAMINSWLALFNLIPLFNFDGQKVLIWNRKYYFIAISASIVLVTISFIFIGF